LSCHIDEKLFAFVANTLSRFMAVAIKILDDLSVDLPENVVSFDKAVNGKM